jgi:DNA-binding transcriptional ArsR family regulator
LLESGRQTRLDVIARLRGGARTEDELASDVGVHAGTVRNVLALLREKGLVVASRRKSDKRGPGPLEYALAASGSPERIEQSLHEDAPEAAPPPADPAALNEVFVIVKRGTNDAVLTKDGRMLRVRADALEETLAHYQKVLRGVALEPLTLGTYYRTYYPERNGHPEPTP